MDDLIDGDGKWEMGEYSGFRFAECFRTCTLLGLWVAKTFSLHCGVNLNN